MSSLASGAQRPVRPKLWSSSADQLSVARADDLAQTSPAAVLASPPSPTLHTRVGLSYQARVPSLAPPATVLSTAVEGEAVWQPSKAPNDAAVESYLSAVQDLFADRPDDFDEETALLFLHRCDYNTGLALALVQPHAIASRDSDQLPADAGAASPSLDLSPPSSEDSESESRR